MSSFNAFQSYVNTFKCAATWIKIIFLLVFKMSLQSYSNLLRYYRGLRLIRDLKQG